MWGILEYRGVEGFTRNVLWANQVDLFLRYAGLGLNSALQASKIFCAVYSAAAVILGIIISRFRCPSGWVVSLGCLFTGLSLVAVACAALLAPSGKASQDSMSSLMLYIGLFGFFPLGFGAATCCLSVALAERVPVSQLTAAMHGFFIYFTVGGIFGIVAAGLAEALNRYTMVFVIAAVLQVLAGVRLALELRSWGELGQAGVGVGAREAREVASYGSVAAAAEAAELALRNASMKGWSTAFYEFLQSAWPLLNLVPFYGALIEGVSSWWVQSSYMDRRITQTVHVPPCMLQLVHKLGAMIFFACFGRIWVRDRSRARSMLPWRFAGGSLAASAAMACGALAEVARRDWSSSFRNSRGDISQLSVAWQLPQFIFLALGEGLVLPAQAEWIDTSPSLSTLAFAGQALAALALALAMPALVEWVPESHPDDGSYEYFFLLLSSLCLVSTALFAAMPRSTWGGKLDAATLQQ